MEIHINRSDVERGAEDTSPKHPRSTLLKLWDEVDANVRSLDASELISLSEFGFDCQPGESAELYGVELDDGCVMLDIHVRGFVIVDVDYLSESLQEEVNRILSRMPEGEVIA